MPGENTDKAEVFSTGDAAGHAALTPPWAAYVVNIDLVVDTAQYVYWPAGYDYCVIAGPADYWGRFGGAAAYPTVGGGNVLGGSGSIYKPTQRKRAPNQERFSLISHTAQVISIEFYKAK